MEFGFAASSDTRNVTFQLARNPSAGIPLVSFARSDIGAAALCGRLHYRDDLLRGIGELGLPDRASNRDGNDAELALRAYAKKGTHGLARLEGEFCLVVWDAARRCLLARRDPLGAYPLYWTRSGRSIVFATGTRALLSHRASDAPNLDGMADFLAGVHPAGGAAAEACAYQDIRQVGTDTIFQVDIDDGSETRERCWGWLDHVVKPDTDRLEDIAEQYGALLRAAVAERLRGRNASHLSGGLDSTSTTLLARDAIEGGLGEPPLHTLSLVYRQLSTLALETPYIESLLAEAHRGLVGHRVCGDDILHFDILENPPPHDEPCAGLWAFGQECALAAKAAELKVDSLLTGQGADDLLHISPDYLADLVSRGRFVAAWQGARAWARAKGSNPWGILRRHAFAHLSAKSSRIREPPRRRPTHLNESADWNVSAWIRDDFARRHGIAEKAAANRLRAYRQSESTVESLALTAIERRIGEPERAVVAAPLGIHLTHPFLDPRVIGFGLGMQRCFREPLDQRKPVLAEAMRGVVPESIRTRRSTRPFNEVLYVGLSRNLPSLKRLILQAPIDDLGMIDKPILIRCLEEAALGVVMPSRLRRLNETLSLVTWLSRRSEWERRPFVPAREIRIPVLRDNVQRTG